MKELTIGIWMMVLSLVLGFTIGKVFSYEIQKVDDMKIEMEVKEIVHAICTKTPFTKTSRCVRKKLKCINEDYSHGAELENAVMDCF